LSSLLVSSYQLQSDIIMRSRMSDGAIQGEGTLFLSIAEYDFHSRKLRPFNVSTEAAGGGTVQRKHYYGIGEDNKWRDIFVYNDLPLPASL
jgi:hypothetical protein